LLRESNSPRTLKLLVDLLKSDDAEKGKSAAYALGELKEPASLEYLIAELNNEDVTASGLAAYALGRTGDKRAIGPLIGLMKRGDRISLMRATNALREITGKNLGPDSTKWEQWWNETGQRLGGGPGEQAERSEG
jgi:HEAT repeat protein